MISAFLFQEVLQNGRYIIQQMFMDIWNLNQMGILMGMSGWTARPGPHQIHIPSGKQAQPWSAISGAQKDWAPKRDLRLLIYTPEV